MLVPVNAQLQLALCDMLPCCRRCNGHRIFGRTLVPLAVQVACEATFILSVGCDDAVMSSVHF